MNVNLPFHLESLVKQTVNPGLYSSTSEVDLHADGESGLPMDIAHREFQGAGRVVRSMEGIQG